MSKKIIILVVVIIVLLAGVLGFMTFKKTNSRFATEPTQNNLVDTSNWKTYSNTKYGFEVKYPPNMIASNMTIAYLEGISDIKNADGIGPGVNIKNNQDLKYSISLQDNNKCLEGTCLLSESSYKEYCDFYGSWFTKYGTTYCKIDSKLGTYLSSIEKRRAFDITNNTNERWYNVEFSLSPSYIFLINGRIVDASFSTDDLNKEFVDAVYDYYAMLSAESKVSENTSVNNALSKSTGILNGREDGLIKIMSTFKFSK